MPCAALCAYLRHLLLFFSKKRSKQEKTSVPDFTKKVNQKSEIMPCAALCAYLRHLLLGSSLRRFVYDFIPRLRQEMPLTKPHPQPPHAANNTAAHPGTTRTRTNKSTWVTIFYGTKCASLRHHKGDAVAASTPPAGAQILR